MAGTKRLAEFMTFLALGTMAAITNLVVRYLLDFIMPFELAVVLAYITDMVAAFVLFRHGVFGNPGTPMRRQVIRFVRVNVLGLALTWAVSTLMACFVLPAVGWTFHAFEVAHLIGVAAPTFSSYFLYRLYTFR